MALQLHCVLIITLLTAFTEPKVISDEAGFVLGVLLVEHSFQYWCGHFLQMPYLVLSEFTDTGNNVFHPLLTVVFFLSCS